MQESKRNQSPIHTLSLHLTTIFFFSCFQAEFTIANSGKKNVHYIKSTFLQIDTCGLFFFFLERGDQTEQRQLLEAQIPCLPEWVLVIKSLAHLILPVSQAKSQSLHLIAYICVHVSQTRALMRVGAQGARKLCTDIYLTQSEIKKKQKMRQQKCSSWFLFGLLPARIQTACCLAFLFR